jgi:hypothetical protein
MKNAVFRDVTRATLVRTDASEKRIASIIRVKRIGELGTILAASKCSLYLSLETVMGYAFV